MGKRFTTLFISLLLAACSGGGGSGGSAPARNQAPVADAGVGVTVNSGDFVSLDGSASRDPDGVIVQWQWQQLEGSAVELEQPDAAGASFIAPEVLADMDLVFSLTVSDSDGASATDTVTIRVEPSVSRPAFSIGGQLSTSSSQALDSDINNPDRLSVANDTPETAQPISNPITLGGYVNLPGTGDPGRSTSAGDPDDFFLVDLLAGQRVTMLVADFDRADADLYLYDTSGEIIDFSIATGEVESLTIATSGTYLINASAFEGATNYLLAVGNQAAAQGATGANPDIVPWQAVVAYREKPGASPADLSGPDPAAEDLAYSLGMAKRAGARGRGQLLQLRAAAAQRQRENRLRAAAGKREAITQKHLRARWETLLTIKTLRRDPRVAFAEPNYRLHALSTPDDEAYPVQWHLPMINLPAAWDLTIGGADVIVAVVDSGVLTGHPDLSGQLLAGYDFVRDPELAVDGDGIDPDPGDPGGIDPGSNSYHGSHVSGTVAAAGDNGIGVAGVAYGARVMPLRALGRGGTGTSYDVRQAIRYAAGLANDSGQVPAARADIINLSLGGGAFSRADQDLFDELWRLGITVVAAAGNEASRLPSYPAAYEHVISVSAVDSQRRLARYSNTGPAIDIAAPGGDNSVDINGDGYPDGVLSTGASNSGNGTAFAYTFLNGTSMAAPHVAGVFALMKSVNRSLSAADIEAMLQRGELTDDLGAGGRDDLFGHGLVNAQRAVAAALAASGSTPADSPRLVASADTLSFSGSSSVLNLTLGNAGAGDLRLLSLSAEQDWLSLTPLATDAAGLGSYQVRVDREGLAVGVHGGEIIATSSVNNLSIAVLVTVGGPQTAADIGVVYLLLQDATSDEAIAQFDARFADGAYRFQFDAVPQGNYFLFAGTDSDNDLFICDAGEACGAWLTTDQPILIELDSDRDGIDFPVEFQVAIPTLEGSGTAHVPTAAKTQRRARTTAHHPQSKLRMLAGAR